MASNIFASAHPFISAGASALGSIASSAIGSALTYAGSKQAYHRQRNLMNLQHDLQVDMNRRQYRDARYALESAGYNPLLAVGSSAGSQTIAGGSAPNPTYDSPKFNLTELANAESLAQSANLSKQQAIGNDIDNYWKPEMITATIDKLVSESANNNSESQLRNAQTLGEMIRNRYLPQYLKADINKAISDTVRNYQEGNASIMNAESNQRRNNFLNELTILEGLLTQQKTTNLEQDYRWRGWESTTAGVRDIGVGVGGVASAVGRVPTGGNFAEYSTTTKTNNRGYKSTTTKERWRSK